MQPEITDFLPDWKATKEQRKYWLENFHIKENKEFLKSVPNIGDHLLILEIILKKTNEFIGWCLTAPKDELPSPNREIAYAISKDYRGRGYTTEAANVLMKYLFEKTDTTFINAIALTHNKPSNRVIQKCGFNLIGNIEIESEEFFQYKINKNEWINKRKEVCRMKVRDFEEFDERCSELYDKDKKYPLFIALHNSNGHAEYFGAHWESQKLEEEYIVLTPQSSQLFHSLEFII